MEAHGTASATDGSGRSPPPRPPGPFGRWTPDVFAIALPPLVDDPVKAMEPGVLLAYELPVVYRRVLDALVDLERAGDRNAAIRLRRKALRLYATSWDPGTLRRMREIADEAARALTAARTEDGSPLADRTQWEGTQGPTEPATG